METINISHDAAVDLALVAYVGFKCTECGHEFDSVRDLKERNPKCSGKDKDGIKLACGECFTNLPTFA